MDWYLTVLKNYAGFSGRARRKEFWMFSLINFVIAVLLAGIGTALDTNLLSLIYSLAVLVPSLAVLVRRLHDTGRSGWWALIAVIPIIGGIVLIIFTVLEGDQAPNAHGVNPKLAAAQA